jgi:signal transduction histidine kinase
MFDLLNFGRPLNSSSLQKQPLVSIVSSAVELWKQSRLMKPCPAVVVRHPQGNDIKILADGAKIQQALLNLLNNAEEASPIKSEIVVTVSKAKERMVRVSVTDEGCGIKFAGLSHIFDPFVTFKKGGIGLGLSIVRNIVEAHGGKVNARNNEPPPGCTIEFILPILDGAQS